MLESEYVGLVIEKVPEGCNCPDALSSDTAMVKVPLTTSVGAKVGGPGLNVSGST
jgi:hypothetical protein